MRKRINIQLLIIAALTIVSTLLLVEIVSYNSFKKQVSEDLKIYSHVLKSTYDSEEKIQDYYKSEYDDFRVTIIEKDGVVRFDSNADIASMDNHSNRPEVIEAFKNGEGQAIRKSDTMNKNTFYYAVILNDGSVLRVAKETDSIWGVFISTIPIVILISIMLFIICMILANIFTRSIVNPIDKIADNIDDLEGVSIYKELVPFINKINKQHEDILKSSIMRQEFTANVSHELKSPLTAISGYSQLIENGMAQDGDVIRFASEIHRNSDRLLKLINDIINLSELDSVDIDVPFENIDLYKIAQNCVNMIEINTKKNNINISLEGESSYILANKQMIEEVIYNLCDNSIRYSKKGGSIKVSVNKFTDKVILSVKDSGIGISKEHQERIFERFYRVYRSHSKLTGGTGLGLAIVKHIVTKHNASMELESEFGKGTEIKIIFN
jgi:two-component system phosphate regulon sensor histidine kinase PhoR